MFYIYIILFYSKCIELYICSMSVAQMGLQTLILLCNPVLYNDRLNVEHILMLLLANMTQE